MLLLCCLRTLPSDLSRSLDSTMLFLCSLYSFSFFFLAASRSAFYIISKYSLAFFASLSSTSSAPCLALDYFSRSIDDMICE